MKVLKAVPERRKKKKSQNGRILEVEEMHKCVITRVGNYSEKIGNIWRAEELVVVEGWLLAVHQRDAAQNCNGGTCHVHPEGFPPEFPSLCLDDSFVCIAACSHRSS